MMNAIVGFSVKTVLYGLGVLYLILFLKFVEAVASILDSITQFIF